MSKATIAPTRRGLLAGMALIAGALALPAPAQAATAKYVVLLGDSAFANADEIREDFTTSYRKMLDAVLARKLPTAISTIHDSRYSDAERAGMANTALAIYNDVITREAFARGLPLVDLRLIMSEQADYANPIEPSAKGGEKIARAVATLLTTHDFASKRSEIYVE